eukprot:1145218-Pelagomonas_calceolata.AAC.2
MKQKVKKGATTGPRVEQAKEAKEVGKREVQLSLLVPISRTVAAQACGQVQGQGAHRPTNVDLIPTRSGMQLEHAPLHSNHYPMHALRIIQDELRPRKRGLGGAHSCTRTCMHAHWTRLDAWTVVLEQMLPEC